VPASGPGRQAAAEPADPSRAPSARPRIPPALSKVGLELFAVFAGVSAAFAVDDYRDARNTSERRQAVYRALDREMEQMAVTRGPAMQRELTKELADWDQALARGEKPLPPAFRIADAERPPTGVWKAAVATGSIELINPDLFYELARFYVRADSVGDLYQRYSTGAQTYVWPHLHEGPSAFWEPDGKLKFEVQAHVQRLRDFRDRQGAQNRAAIALKEKLRVAALEDR
jgi:hypothetical protein